MLRKTNPKVHNGVYFSQKTQKFSNHKKDTISILSFKRGVYLDFLDLFFLYRSFLVSLMFKFDLAMKSQGDLIWFFFLIIGKLGCMN